MQTLTTRQVFETCTQGKLTVLVEHCFEIMSEPNETLTAPRRATYVPRSFARSPALKRTPFFLVSTEYAAYKRERKRLEKKEHSLGMHWTMGGEPMEVLERRKSFWSRAPRKFWG